LLKVGREDAMRFAAFGFCLTFAACARPTLVAGLRGDEPTAEEAIRAFVARGEAGLPELKAAAVDADPLVRRRAKTAIGRITGQFGSETGLIWKRAMKDAVGQGKPIVLLHLFGELDKEFC
jgi:hypothetical protein